MLVLDVHVNAPTLVAACEIALKPPQPVFDPTTVFTLLNKFNYSEGSGSGFETPKLVSAGPELRMSTCCDPLVPAPPTTKPDVRDPFFCMLASVDILISLPGFAESTTESNAEVLVTEPLLLEIVHE